MPMPAWEMCAVAVDKNDKHKVYVASREKIYLLDWSDPANRKVTFYFSALPGEKISDLLFDELTISSSSGFFALSQS